MGKLLLIELPPEILNEMVQYLPCSDLSSLTRTTRFFYDDYTPTVWRCLALPSLCFQVDPVTDWVGFLGNNAKVYKQIDAILQSPKRDLLLQWTEHLSLKLESTTFPRPPGSQYKTTKFERVEIDHKGLEMTETLKNLYLKLARIRKLSIVVYPIKVHSKDGNGSEIMLSFYGESAAKFLYRRILGTFSGIDQLRKLERISIDVLTGKDWPKPFPTGCCATRPNEKTTFKVLCVNRIFRERYETMTMEEGADSRKRKIKFYCDGKLNREHLFIFTDEQQR